MADNGKFVMRLDVDIAPPVRVGKTDKGELYIIPITGGSFEGPDMKGEVCAGGADWNTRIGPDSAHVFAKYWIKASDGEVISIQNEAMIYEKEGEPIITSPRFEADRNGKYAFLSENEFVGELVPQEGGQSVSIFIYKKKAD